MLNMLSILESIMAMMQPAADPVEQKQTFDINELG